LELDRRRVLAVLTALAVIGTSAAALVLRGGRPDRVSGHAFAIPSAEARIVVEVLNGTGRPGRARSATRVLRRQGLDVVFFGNWESAGLVRKTKVVVRRGGDQAPARRVAQALGAGAVVVDLDSLRRVDVTVILGEDWKAAADVGL
jgi:S1-C subfamily serine protease